MNEFFGKDLMLEIEGKKEKKATANDVVER